MNFLDDNNFSSNKLDLNHIINIVENSRDFNTNEEVEERNLSYASQYNISKVFKFTSIVLACLCIMLILYDIGFHLISKARTYMTNQNKDLFQHSQPYSQNFRNLVESEVSEKNDEDTQIKVENYQKVDNESKPTNNNTLLSPNTNNTESQNKDVVEQSELETNLKILNFYEQMAVHTYKGEWHNINFKGDNNNNNTNPTNNSILSSFVNQQKGEILLKITVNNVYNNEYEELKEIIINLRMLDGKYHDRWIYVRSHSNANYSINSQVIHTNFQTKIDQGEIFDKTQETISNNIQYYNKYLVCEGGFNFTFSINNINNTNNTVYNQNELIGIFTAENDNQEIILGFKFNLAILDDKVFIHI